MPTVSYEEVLKTLSPEARKRVKERGDTLIKEYESLQAVRKELGITQAEVAKFLKLNQSNISDMEARNDMKISSLKAYAQALGYEMNIIFKAADDTTIRVDEVFNS